MITFTMFSLTHVFEDARLNVFFNQFYTTIVNRFGLEYVEPKLLLDDRVALLLQEEAPAAKFQKLKVTTSDIAIYNFIKNSLNSLDIRSFQIKEDFIIIELKSDYLVYFHLDQSAVNFVTAKAINVRLKTDIK